MRIALFDVVSQSRARWIFAAAALFAALVARPALPAYASSVASVSIVPADLTAGATTSYSVSFVSTIPLAAGGTITIDWTGDGVSEGVIQPLSPATVTFTGGDCVGTVTVTNGNSVISLANDASMFPCALSNAQFTITNVRNPIVGSSSAGSIRTSADATAVGDPAILTWVPGGLSVTAKNSFGTGPAVTTVAPTTGLASVNFYPSGLEFVTFTTSRGIFYSSNQQTLVCYDVSSPCDADGLLNRVITVYLIGDGTAGPAVITASSKNLRTVTTTVTFADTPPAPPPPVVPPIIVTATTTGVFCFSYTGPSLLPANFASSFALAVVSVNVAQVDGSYTSWFRAVPGLATATGLTPGQTVCVSAPPGTNVFAGG